MDPFAKPRSSPEDMFQPLQRVVQTKVFGAATGKMVGMLVVVEDDQLTIEARAGRLCGAVWPRGSRGYI